MGACHFKGLQAAGHPAGGSRLKQAVTWHLGGCLIGEGLGSLGLRPGAESKASQLWLES